VTAIEERLLEMYADPALDEKPKLLEQRGGAYYSEAAVDLVASLSADRGDVQVVNVRNGDRLPFLPAEAVIEVPARITAAGADPLPVDPVEPLYAGLIAHVTAYEELAIEAALKGGVDRVTDALLAHPLIGQVSTATDLAGRLVAANAAHLPWAVGA
jgi:6-phospho-beta-glucosidase